MFGANAHYGHRSILNQYAGVPVGTRIPGIVEHGWNYDLGAALEDVLRPAPAPFFVWSEPNLHACQEAGLGDRVVAIGAPFLYMPPVDKPIEPKSKSLLVMPAHGWERARLTQDFERYARDLQKIEHEFSSITVCLYWFEHQEEHNRRIFESRGFRVVTAGLRDNNPDFLFNLRKFILEHEYVSANRVTTATFYALHLGRKFFIYGASIGVEQWIDRAGTLFDAWQRRHYPMLAWENFQDDAHPDLAARELGLPCMRSPDQLRELFFWRPEQRLELDSIVQAFALRERERGRLRRVDLWKKALHTIPILRRYLS